MVLRERSAYRWGVVALICLGTALNYLCRNSLAVLAPQLETALHFGAAEYSYIVAAFQGAYMLMLPVCGFIVDWIGVRSGFALFALLWSIVGAAHALSGSWVALAVNRGLLGAFEAAAIPSGVKAVSEWFAAESRSQAIGWINVGTSIGAMIAPPLTVALALAYDWRAALAATGLVGALWSAAWFTLYRSPRPAQQERAMRWSLLTSRRFWALVLPRFLAEPAWQTFSFWIPLFLATERHLDLAQIAIFAWAPFLAADLGGIAGGYLSPWLKSRFKLSILRARQMGFTLGAILMIAPGSIALTAGPFEAIALLCVGAFAHQIISVSINTLSADLFASEELGTANGLIGSMGWAGGLLFSLLIGQIVDVVGYGPLFACLAIFDILGAVSLFMLLRPLREMEILQG